MSKQENRACLRRAFGVLAGLADIFGDDRFDLDALAALCQMDDESLTAVERFIDLTDLERAKRRRTLPELLGVAQVAEWLRFSPSAIRAFAQKGILPAERDEHGRWRFRKTELHEHMMRYSTRAQLESIL